MFKVVTVAERDVDKGRQRLYRGLGQIDRAAADVGIFDDPAAGSDGKRPDGELTQAQTGAVHEFGAEIPVEGRAEPIKIPERSWLRSNHDKNAAKYRERLDRQYERVLAGKSGAVTALMAFAERVASDVRRNITKLRTPPLSAVTIARKGSSNPLIDTGSMRNAVQGRVILKGRKVS